ncbi:hypothetical protein [Croceimicrobium hydrocarbonivorans]|uniref:Lipoprotein n=1 Tax=Croceimicrobium hydrocarbonivorans TaxID=2761580 RepID=A0A7H0VHI8_9FLAO|nr:hypothetical protein [Croceimicrobium hydrocarbonivorans]QNR25186.1 hypothetical protein H4K34_04925 [Croceimicrobium hydrocarbonivorans]
MKNYFLILAFLFMAQACTNRPEAKVEASQTESPEIKEPETKYPDDLNATVSSIDTNLNPLVDINFTLRECPKDSLSDPINCILSQIPSRPLPMHFGPIPYFDYYSLVPLEDSLFISEALQDTNYFVEEERQYSYFLGVKIPSPAAYTALIVLESFSIGKDYILVTISESGEMIDKLRLGSEAGDYESLFGKIESLEDIEVITKKIDYNKEEDLLFFKSTETTHYYINEVGEILKR